MIVRVGRCLKCGVCCKWHFRMVHVDDQDNLAFYLLEEGSIAEPYSQSFNLVATPRKCEMLLPNNRCKLHGSRDQPKVCQNWPYRPDQDYFRAVNILTTCGYSFMEIEVDCPNPLA